MVCDRLWPFGENPTKEMLRTPCDAAKKSRRRLELKPDQVHFERLCNRLKFDHACKAV